MRFNLIILVMCISITSYGQRQTDGSLFMKKQPSVQLQEVSAKHGDLYKELGHHGPAIENLWVGYRFYFNSAMSVDLLSKFQPRLELKTAKWYGNDSLFAKGFGKDNFKVWKTVGLGGIRLLDGSEIKNFETSTNRTAKIIKTDTTSTIEMLTEGIFYQERLVDIVVRMTVFNNKRYACIEAEVLDGTKVNFVTGIVIHDELVVKKRKGSVLTWGDYDSPAASESFNVGAALIFKESDILREIEEVQQLLYVSKPTSKFKYYITSANEKEQSNLNTLEAFENYITSISQEQH